MTTMLTEKVKLETSLRVLAEEARDQLRASQKKVLENARKEVVD